MICCERRLVRFGSPGVLLLLERSIVQRSAVPAARFANLLLRLEGRVSSSSKSVGRKAAGALWKSTITGAGRRSAAERARRFPWDILCTLLPKESSDLVLLMLEKLGERREKLLVMLAMLSLRITELAEARIGFSTLRVPIPGNGKISFVQTSSSPVSSLILSARLGAKVGT
jgi:hypothetical protein